METPQLSTGPRTRRPQPGDNRALLFGDRPSARAPIPGAQPELGAAETELLETRNGAAVDALRDRVGDMRHLALNIENEVSEQNKFLDGMSDTFENAGGHMADTMRALRRLSRNASGGHLCILFMFAALFFFLAYLLLR